MSDFNHAINLTHDGTLIIRIPKGYQVDKVVVEEMGTENRKEYQPTHKTPSNTLGALDCVERQAAIDALKICDNNEDGINCHKCPLRDERWDGAWQDDETNCYTKLMRDSAKLLEMPSAQPGITRCKDCKWWDKQEMSLQGRCSLFQMYPTGEWYCGNAVMRGDQE